MKARSATEPVLNATPHGVVSPCQSGGSSLGTARAAMAEVQICGIPKLSAREVALTP